jgi:hypothetical protein
MKHRSSHPPHKPTGACGRSGRRWALAGAVAALSLLASGAAAPTAWGDYQGPDENTGQAYGPLEGGYTYQAKLNNNGSNPDDQDWYYFYVPRAGERLDWTVSNTTATTGCVPYGPYAYCEVWATLEDSSGHQLGGDNSSAGTSGVGPGGTQQIYWTFASPGRYYIAFVGGGDELSYQFSVSPADGVSSLPVGGGAPSGGAPSLRLAAHQAGRFVDFSLTVPTGGGRLAARLYELVGRRRVPAGSLGRAHVAAGRHQYALRLSGAAWRALARRGRLTLILDVTVTRTNGSSLRGARTLQLRRRRRR